MATLALNGEPLILEALEPQTGKVMARGRLEVDVVLGPAPVIHNNIQFITIPDEEATA